MSWPLLASCVGTLQAQRRVGRRLLSCTVLEHLWPSPCIFNVPADHCRHQQHSDGPALWDTALPTSATSCLRQPHCLPASLLPIPSAMRHVHSNTHQGFTLN